MPKKSPFSSPPAGWTVLFIAFAASLLTLCIIYKKEVLSARSSSPSTTTKATDSTFYNGLPLGALELTAYLLEESSEHADRVLRAYAAGRLSVSPRVYDSRGKERFAQAIRLPYINEVSDPLLEPECGYYGGTCALILGEDYRNPSASRYISGMAGREGYVPLKFLNKDTLLLRGRLGDGGCGSTYYKDVDFLSGASSHSLTHTICNSEEVEISFDTGTKNIVILRVRDQKTSGSIESSNLYKIDIRQGEPIVQTLENIVLPKGNTLDEAISLDWIKPDLDAYFTNPSELRLMIGDGAYTFPVPQD